MEPEFVNESMWDEDEDGANNDETNFGEDDSNMEMSGFDGSTTGDGTIAGGGEGGAVGDAQVEFYLRPNGRINLRLNNFTFYKHLKARSNAYRWSCTAYGSKWKCKAHLVITDKLEVLKASITHSHPPSLKKDPRLPYLYPLVKEERKDKQNGHPELVHPPSLTPLHDYLVAHSVYSNY